MGPGLPADVQQRKAPIRLSLVGRNRHSPLAGFLKVPAGDPLALHFDKGVCVLNLCQGIRRITIRRKSISVICLGRP
ncbi:hypothetical protein C5Y97_19260 [Blastopirellula marina]|uniref:Uncharacterized protein n=1 Tax=Blastopirellula marina TaxID=124 RepID=A0A2S8FHB0_9BACT|nr:hypothetical protein C5Y98_19250 [Blastopirellula marina]PTL42865.1 hypothetical protein C5Y97_19260 [Blastopirellula marina]